MILEDEMRDDRFLCGAGNIIIAPRMNGFHRLFQLYDLRQGCVHAIGAMLTRLPIDVNLF